MQLLLLSLSCFYSDLLNSKARAAPPVGPAEVRVAVPLELQHEQLPDVHLRVNEEGVCLVCGNFGPECRNQQIWLVLGIKGFSPPFLLPKMERVLLFGRYFKNAKNVQQNTQDECQWHLVYLKR